MGSGMAATDAESMHFACSPEGYFAGLANPVVSHSERFVEGSCEWNCFDCVVIRMVWSFTVQGTVGAVTVVNVPKLVKLPLKFRRVRSSWLLS